MEKSIVPAGGAFLLEATEPDRVFIPEEFDSETQLIGRTAADFLRKEVLPHVERIEQGDLELMHDLMRKAGELGLLAADVPEIYGGLGRKHTTSALIAEKINWQQSFALTHEAHTVIATLPLLFFGNPDQKSRYLPKLASGEWIGCFALSEANSGSDALAMQTKATLAPDGKHYLLNGVKMWITNTAFAQLFTVFGKVDGEKVTVFLVERDFPGVSFGKEEHKLGMHGTSTRRLILENVPVPVENVLEIGKGHYAAFCALNLGRFKLEAGAVGGLKETLAVCTRYATQRRAFGHALAEFGLIQHKLAEMAARTFALESMVYRLAGNLDGAFEGIVPDAPNASVHYHRAAEEYAIECNIVKVIGSETYSHMTDEAIQIHGGYGYTEEFPVARAWRDQRLLRIGEGANEIVRLAIINTLLRRDKQGRLPLRDTARRYLAEVEADLQHLLHEAVAHLNSKDDSATGRADVPIEAIGGAAEDTKRLALTLLALAVERLGDTLIEEEEIAAAVADVVCAAYALESVWLRCRKLQGQPRFATALLAAQVAVVDYTDEALAAARYFFGSLPKTASSGAEPPAGALALIARLAYRQGSQMLLRRDLAARVLEKDGYPL